MLLHHAMKILLAPLAICFAVLPAQAANVSTNATREMPSEEWAGAAILLPSVAQSSSSSDPKVGDPQGSKVSPGTDTKQEAVQGATGATSSDPKDGDPQGSKTPPAMEPKQETAVQNGSNGAGGATNSPKPTTSFPPSYESSVITFTPGFRVQVRYIHDTQSSKDEIFVARVRLKAKGVLFHTVKYYVEYKFDTLGRPGRDMVNGFENAWLEYSVARNLAIRGGLYDVPFSRNALTSDSKLLFIDRSLIKDTLTSFGFADNTTGLLGHGRPFKGRVEYSVGIFNNEKFRKIHHEANNSDHLMPAGRVVYHFLDPAPQGGYADYQSSYVGGKGKRLAIGANSAYLSKARDAVNEFNLLGWGTDAFFSTGPFSAEAEYDQLRKKLIRNPDIQMDGWYVQAGYLVKGRVEFAARHQQLDPNASVSNNQLRWTSLGSNIYFRKHNVKLQVDYTFRRGSGQTVKTNVLQMQMQVDY